MSNPTAILVDWGTSSFRAWLTGAEGRVIERRTAELGIMQVPDGGFGEALEHQVGDWRSADADLPVLMSGMVGSRQGWVEAPYAPCPAGLTDLAKALVAAPGDEAVRIVPGISYRAADGRHDVIRGEEIQIFGALGLAVDEAAAGAADGRQLFCLPGTHSKWASIAAGRIDWFATSMTGEIYSVMAEHSILGRLMAPGGADHAESFRRGLALAAEPGGLLNHLFAVRAEALFGAVPEQGVRSYLSGILIGHEIRAMTAIAGTADSVTVIGRPDITRLYGEALGHAGRAADTVTSEDATLMGLALLRQAEEHA